MNKHFGAREERSFEVEHTNGFWHLDFHAGSWPQTIQTDKQGIRLL